MSEPKVKPTRANRRNPCPICGGSGCGLLLYDDLAFCWRVKDGRAGETRIGSSVFRYCAICAQWGACGTSEDGKRPYCFNVVSDRTTRTGAFVHSLNGTLPSLPSRYSSPVNRAQNQATLAPIEKRDAVFTGLLEGLTLSGRHSDDLKRRGLSDSEVTRQLYSSSPDQRAAQALTDNLVTRFGDLNGVPGFHRSGERWHLVSLAPGLLIPVRDHKGRIQALRLRRDEPEGARYIWVSSRCYPSGTGSGAPMHWVRPWRVDVTSRLIITEGEMKGQAASDLLARHLGLDEAFLCLPGVSSFTTAIGEDLRRLFPMLNRIAIAYDTDWATKASVLSAMLRLGSLLRASGFSVSTMEWPETVAGVRAKGIDDFSLLLTNEQYNIGRGN